MATASRAHTPRGGGSSGARARPAPHPGTSGGAGSSREGTGFVSPYQPPASIPDLASDLLDPGTWTVIHVAGSPWRVKFPTPSALGLLHEILSTDVLTAQLRAMSMYMAAHMDPGDLRILLERMGDPDDPLSATDYRELFRAAVRVGTARPFRLPPDWRELPPRRGGPSEHVSR